MAHSTGDPPADPTASISERERFLQRVPLFDDLDAEELRALAEVAQPVRFPESVSSSAKERSATAPMSSFEVPFRCSPQIGTVTKSSLHDSMSSNTSVSSRC